MNLVLYIFIILLLLFFSFVVLSLIIIYNTKENFTSQYNEYNSNSLIKTPMKFTQQLDFLTYSKFQPECCPSVYSNSKGCLCYNNDEDISIITRGNNRHFTKNDCYIKSITKRKKLK